MIFFIVLYCTVLYWIGYYYVLCHLVMFAMLKLSSAKGLYLRRKDSFPSKGIVIPRSFDLSKGFPHRGTESPQLFISLEFSLCS